MPALPAAVDTRLERDLAVATAAAGLALLAALAAERWLGLGELSLVFLTAVVVVALRSSMGVAVYASLLCFLAYNYFFVEPRYTLYVSANEGLVAVFAFLACALLCGRLASRLRSQVLLLRSANAQAESLQKLGRRLVEANDADAAIAATVAALRDALDVEVAVLRKLPGGALEECTHPGAPVLRFDPGLQVAASRAIQAGADAGFEAQTEELAWRCLPLRAAGVVTGAVCLHHPAHGLSVAPEQARLAEAMVRDLAQALVRMQLGSQLEHTRVRAESERLRAALLASVSHDLRSPLSTIIGSAESLEAYGDSLSAADRRQLASDIRSEGQRLDRYVQNLLDMTRLEHGPVLDKEWIGVDEVIGGAVRRLSRAHPHQAVAIFLPPELPLLRVNAPLLEQAFFNVLDNAARHSPPGATIRIGADLLPEELRVEVGDAGPGIPAAERERVFDMFHRIAHGDRKPEGTGLGLAICRAILAAHGGSVAVAEDAPAGTVIRFVLPLEPAPEPPGEE